MANKRVSELAPITALAADDLLLLADVSAFESKKMTLSEIQNYVLSGGVLTGSFYGTASYANRATDAIFASSAGSSSYASSSTVAVTSTSATVAISSSYASASLSSSFSLTASYAANVVTPILTTSASFLVYSSTNGTASFAISASNTVSSSYANGIANTYATITETEARLDGPVLNVPSLRADPGFWVPPVLEIDEERVNITGLWNLSTLDGSYLRVDNKNVLTTTSTASMAATASRALTASFAIEAGLSPTIYKDYGVVLAISKSSTTAAIDNIIISSTILSDCSSSFEAWGNVIIPYTGSKFNDTSISLILLNRWSGITKSLDSSPVTINLGGTTDISGTLKLPFTLAGDAVAQGPYSLYLTASSNVTSISLDTSRTPRFNVVSMGDIVTFGAGDPLELKTSTPTDILTIYSGSLAGSPVGPQFASASALVAAGSSSKISYLDASSISGSVNYVWTLPIMTEFYCTNNPDATDVGGMPNSIISMSVFINGVSELAPLTYTSCSYLDCHQSAITELPPLPPSMSYINCSDDFITSLPSTMPRGLKYFYCSNTQLTSVSTNFPLTIESMSFSDNQSLTSVTSTLPTAIKSLTIDGCALTSFSQYTLIHDITLNAGNNGTLIMNGNPTLVGAVESASIATDVATLRAGPRSWYVVMNPSA